MFHVSAGKRLKPAAWPNGARVAVGLSFDVDNATAELATGNLISEVDLARRVRRDRRRAAHPAAARQAPASGLVLHPGGQPPAPSRDDPVDPSQSGRHEIGVHGWIHEHLPSVNDAAAEQDMLNRAIETLTKAIGKKPVGYRAPSWQFSPYTMEQVKDAGFLYDSSLMASDDAYEILLDKQPTGVVELPIERIVDDFPYFGGAANGGMPNPDAVEQVFRVGVRRRLRGRRPLHPDDAPAHHRPPLARRGARETDPAHEVEAGRLVRDARADRALRQGEHEGLRPTPRAGAEQLMAASLTGGQCMKRMVLLAIGAVALSTGTFAQTSPDIDKALARRAAQHEGRRRRSSSSRPTAPTTPCGRAPTGWSATTGRASRDSSRSPCSAPASPTSIASRRT